MFTSSGVIAGRSQLNTHSKHVGETTAGIKNVKNIKGSL